MQQPVQSRYIAVSFVNYQSIPNKEVDLTSILTELHPKSNFLRIRLKYCRK